MKNNSTIVNNAPEFLIGGTLFSYQKGLDTFVQRDVPSNRIMMKGIWEDNTWTQFFFDSGTKNIYQGNFPNGERPGHVQLVIMPSLPYCERLGIHVKSYHEKQSEQKDELKSNQGLLQNRRNHKKGRSI
jgi:hypothetical protein